MPVSRSPARSANNMPYNGRPASRSMGMGISGPCSSLLPSLSRAAVHGVSAPPSVSPPARRRRTPNAFILYRSYIITKRLYPPELSHQSDVSRHVAEMWRALTPSERSIFFEMAEEKRRIQLESHGEEPYKTRRSRTRKTNANRNRSRHGEFSPASVEGCPLPTSSIPVSSTPLGIPTPSFDPLTGVRRNSDIPHCIRDEVGSNELESTWLSSSLPTSFQISYQSDAAFFDSLDAEMLNFQLSVSTSTDFVSALYNPSFGVFLPE